jgi:hypothetical protein
MPTKRSANKGAASDLEEVRQAALELLQQSVRQISEANGATSGLFFPNGVHVMEVKIETKDTMVHLSIAGPEVGSIVSESE